MQRTGTLKEEADVVIIGAGLAGLVAASEVVAAGKRVIVLDQEAEQSLGGQAFWSLGGLFFVNSPEQRRLRVRDSHTLALDDWMRTAGFDRTEDHWPRKWAEAYVAFAAGEKRAWLRALGLSWFPVVAWAERGGYGMTGPGNSVPRFHVTWGTGPGVLAPFIRMTRDAERAGRLAFLFRHRADELSVTNGRVDGIHGSVLASSNVERGAKSARDIAGNFEIRAGAVIVTSGGIGGDHDLVRAHWPARLGAPPKSMISGVPDHVDGRVLGAAERAGARWINKDRMWHYTEGVRNWAPIWPAHGIRIIPGPSSLWLDARGHRLPPPLFPGFDTLGTLEYIVRDGHAHSWFVLNQAILRKEFALSGSEQNPDLTGKNVRLVLGRAFGKRATPPVEAFKERGADFVVRNSLDELVAAMNAIAEPQIEAGDVRRAVEERDFQIRSLQPRDRQAEEIRRARTYLGDRLVRVAKPGAILSTRDGPLIAVKLHILTRKSLGGLETDLSSRVLGADGSAIDGLFAAGEAAGFGGGGMHGYRALEGTFLGGCLFSGRIAGRHASGGSSSK